LANSITKLHQTLHGYQNGHQLLASSLALSLAAKRILLFQSDLTGSLENGFESYLTGYPIIESNIYVFARTWYAPEMERPGCVWTHSLILDYADLGKFSDLYFLNEFFVRPSSGDFKSYMNQITLDKTPANVEHPQDNYSPSLKALLTSVYKYSEQTILIPTISAAQYEADIIRLWSEQWPRLRRAFKFCTGSLNLKALDEEEFDVQIIPDRSTSSIARQSSNSVTVNIKDTLVEEWTSVFDRYRKEDIRKFLWTFGADIEGKRANYIPLVRLFESVNSKQFELAEVNSYVNEYFPDIDKGRFLKKNLYGSSSILPVSEKELIQYLVSNGETSMVNFEELHVLDRVIQLVNDKKLSVKEIGDLFQHLSNYSLDNNFWNKLDVNGDLVFSLLERDAQLAPLIIRTWPSIAEDKRAWTLDYPIQKNILEVLKYESIEIFEILRSVLASRSKIIFDFRNTFGSRVSLYTLDLLNSGKGEQIAEEWIEYVVKHDNALEEWFWQNKRLKQKPIYMVLFKYLTPNKLERLQLEQKELVGAFELVKNGATRDFANVTACKILALGFADSSRENSFLVERMFSHVYQEVCLNRMSDVVWKYFTKEYQIRDYSGFFNPFALLSFFQKSRRSEFNVESWDVGRQLIVKAVNQFVRNSWPLQSFLETFFNKKEFREALLYCYTFEKGIRLIEKLLAKVDENKLKLNKEQLEIIRKVLS